LRAPLLARQDDLTKSEAKVSTQISDLIAKIASTQPGTQTKAAANQAKLASLEAERTGDQNALNTVSQQLLALDPSKITPPSVLLPGQLPQSFSSPSKTIDGAAGLAFGRDKMDDRIRGRQDVESVLGVPVLAIIPHVPDWRKREETRLAVVQQPKGAVAEAYRTLRTSVTFLASQRSSKVLMVSGPGVGEGKTTTSANLAVALAVAGKRVILVSADLRKPRLHKFFGMENEIGLS